MTAVIYARYSSDSQREASIEGQLRDCKDYAEKNGITVVGTYIDRAYSAKTDDRPDFQRMIKDSGKKIFDVVLVWKLDRFARNRFDAVNYKYQLEKNGVHLVSAMEPISQGPEGIMVESMLIGMAEYYSAELALKVARGERENALQCKYNGGVVPLGFTIGKEDRLYHIDPETAPIVQEIFTRYADGEPAEKIAASLNKRGLRTHTGQQFAFFQLFDVLHIPVVLALAEGLLFILGHCAVADLQDDLQTGHPADAFQALIVLLGKGNVQLIGQALPGQKVIFGGVHDDAVQVKQKSVLAHLYPPVVGWGQLFTSGRP